MASIIDVLRSFRSQQGLGNQNPATLVEGQQSNTADPLAQGTPIQTASQSSLVFNPQQEQMLQSQGSPALHPLLTRLMKISGLLNLLRSQAAQPFDVDQPSQNKTSDPSVMNVRG